MSKDWGSKPGSGGVMSSSQANIDRRERLRQLALETVDISKDPYIMRNHLGSYECRLCLTLHANEASYLAHTQGKKHQQNLARRAAKISKDTSQNVVAAGAKRVVKKSGAVIPKIGIPEHYVFKVRHPETKQLGLLFILKYPRVGDGIQPRTRFMSALEQKVEVADMNYQYVLFAAEPYNTIAFKVPSKEIDKKDGMFFSDWNEKTRVFAFQFHFSVQNENIAGPEKKQRIQ